MAERVAKYPDKLIGAVACLPLSNINAALKEIDRAINELGFKGAFLHTPVYNQSVENRKGVDSPNLLPIYEKMAEIDLPIWITRVEMSQYPIIPVNKIPVMPSVIYLAGLMKLQ